MTLMDLYESAHEKDLIRIESRYESLAFDINDVLNDFQSACNERGTESCTGCDVEETCNNLRCKLGVTLCEISDAL